MAVFHILPNALGLYQDHIVQWDISNVMFTGQNTVVHVKEGDNLIFTCLKNPSQSLQLLWPQPPWCSTANMKLATIREEDQKMFIIKNNSLLNVSKQNQPFTSKINTYNHEVLSVKHQGMRNPNQQAERSDWNNYRFLLLPGSLALLTLVGMQIVVCTFWLPKSVKRYFRCFASRQNTGDAQDAVEKYCKGQPNFEDPSEYNHSQITTEVVGSNSVHLSRFVTSDHRFPRGDGTQSMSAVIVPQSFSNGPDTFPRMLKVNRCSLKNNVLKTYPYEPFSANNFPTKGLPSSRNSNLITPRINCTLYHPTAHNNENFMYNHVKPTMESTLWIPCAHKSSKPGSMKSTIRFADSP
ncbi:hypothetical protein FGIG_03850 [Fasciola gigantica]|uniref:Uncharacterized protein n=1 Tax=Fasciola gigantica TaxID=46835 RepID=A0A504YD96_FASGI|nr:hypothetical protein FGIG_03850 [Fasciola gigantica]